MRTLAESTKVRFENDQREPQFIRSAVFRYDDQPRRFIDATMWVWTDAGRPIAFEKIEAMTYGSPRWGYCFTSLAFDPLVVEWSHGRRYHTTEPGVEFQVLPDAPEVASRNVQRKRQIRELSREFSARIVTDPRENNSEAMRLLPTPIFEYTDAKSNLLQGAVFGFATSGTNPDLLIVLEVRPEGREIQWYFAPVRMTIGAVTVTHRDHQVWDVPFLEPGDATFPTWTFFPTPRDVDEDE
ncbi:MAG TPA: hypothetical protein VGX76_22245 [Pirellulales bacterium]|nr:hypothetical protein [Pirellulales bacterium]